MPRTKESGRMNGGAKGSGKPAPAAPLMRSPSFEKVYATRAIPFMTDFDIRITLSSEMVRNEQGWFTVADGTVILTPTAAKELQAELADIVRAWEEINGPIKKRPSGKVVATFSTRE